MRGKLPNEALEVGDRVEYFKTLRYGQERWNNEQATVVSPPDDSIIWVLFDNESVFKGRCAVRLDNVRPLGCVIVEPSEDIYNDLI